MPKKAVKSSVSQESSLKSFVESRSKEARSPTKEEAPRTESERQLRIQAASLAETVERHYTDKWRIPERKDWETMQLEKVHELIQKLLACYQEGAQIYNQRTSDAQRESGVYKCIVCGKKKPLTVDNGSRPNYVWRDDRPDPQTRIYSSRIICSQECYFRGSNTGQLTNRGVDAKGTAFKQEDQKKLRA